MVGSSAGVGRSDSHVGHPHRVMRRLLLDRIGVAEQFDEVLAGDPTGGQHLADEVVGVGQPLALIAVLGHGRPGGRITPGDGDRVENAEAVHPVVVELALALRPGLPVLLDLLFGPPFQLADPQRRSSFGNEVH
jgi:hypothetical protein